MYRPSNWEKVQHGFDYYINRLLVNNHQSKLNNTDFTILSNNCWGGLIYEYFGLPKNSPTIGSFFFAEDYLKFLLRFDHYIKQDIIIVDPEESSHFNSLKMSNSLGGLVGKLDDIEIIMLHYHDKIVAKDKWNRRCERINPNNIILKFSFQNNCSYENLKTFDDLDFDYFSSNYKKIMFVPRPMPQYSSSIYYPGFENSEQIDNDTYFFHKYFDLLSFFNNEGLYQR